MNTGKREVKTKPPKSPKKQEHKSSHVTGKSNRHDTVAVALRSYSVQKGFRSHHLRRIRIDFKQRSDCLLNIK
jgi:hypothetical protein